MFYLAHIAYVNKTVYVDRYCGIFVTSVDLVQFRVLCPVTRRVAADDSSTYIVQYRVLRPVTAACRR